MHGHLQEPGAHDHGCGTSGGGAKRVIQAAFRCRRVQLTWACGHGGAVDSHPAETCTG